MLGEASLYKEKRLYFVLQILWTVNFYVVILQGQLLPAAQSMYHNKWRLQQDNDPKHTFRITRVNVIDWPSNSPDLNPIENLWQITKNNVEKRMPQNIEQLKQFLAEFGRRFHNST